MPDSAVVDEAGQDVVYVMLGGESFERRLVRSASATATGSRSSRARTRASGW